MKYAFFPGCVSRGGCSELYPSAVAVAEKLGIELDELTSASCTGAGVLQEKDQRLGDTLNARTFAMAEQKGLPIMTICSTCQGVMSQANHRLTHDPSYLAEVNQELKPEGLEYRGTVTIKHLLWILMEEIGADNLRPLITRPLTGMRVAPFYGCYILRPSWALGLEEAPERETSLERVIELVGAEPVDFPGKSLCCGFPILTINEKNSLAMVARHTGDARERGADAMVTPCPLCHLNLDGYQPKAASTHGSKPDMPILHLPQLLGLAMGLSPRVLGLQRHIVSASRLLDKVKVRA
ncbi:MAG: CoB--CoM heterodisulfide reductase iron-sulfur subunit B family protein [Chloroflexi bacterium]|nr:CoB--CoM heterodisulfide reductase iron-sulfur subunit B family protein [Chloroflexota bacterium]